MRKISELIWHCSATPAGREVTAAEIDRWHRARGFKSIGYHKLVHLDGSVSEGRPESMVGAHVAGRNTGTIGYCYVGGVDANDVKKARDTRTPAQRATMERLTREAIARYGIKIVSGHREYAAKACPCFDARAEYGHLLRQQMAAGDKDPASLARSRTMGGLSTAGAGTVGTAASEQLSEMAGQLAPIAYLSSALTTLFICLTLAGIGWAAYARWDDAGRPVPWGSRT